MKRNGKPERLLTEDRTSDQDAPRHRENRDSPNGKWSNRQGHALANEQRKYTAVIEQCWARMCRRHGIA